MKPRRFRVRVSPGMKHPNGSEREWIYGCYFPGTDLVVGEMGGRGTGEPKDVEWLDLDDDRSRCAWEGCERQGTKIACGREHLGRAGHADPATYCDDHARIVADEGTPEYIETCPNCGCRFGVN